MSDAGRWALGVGARALGVGARALGVGMPEINKNSCNRATESLGKNQLLELHYGLLPNNQYRRRTENCFPDPEEMELIWAPQRKLQTLQHTHLLTLLEISATSELETHVVRQEADSDRGNA